MLGPLADNGGPTFTHALLPGSPAIDAGDPAAVAGVGNVPLYDQRGFAFSRVAGGRIDIGAFEAARGARRRPTSTATSTWTDSIFWPGSAGLGLSGRRATRQRQRRRRRRRGRRGPGRVEDAVWRSAGRNQRGDGGRRVCQRRGRAGVQLRRRVGRLAAGDARGSAPATVTPRGERTRSPTADLRVAAKRLPPE